jgi:hypothetical protein
MRDYVRALLAPVARKNSRQLGEHAGHATPDGLQHLLSRARWNPDDIRDDLQTYVAEHLGRPDGVLIIVTPKDLYLATTAELSRHFHGSTPPWAPKTRSSSASATHGPASATASALSVTRPHESSLSGNMTLNRGNLRFASPSSRTFQRSPANPRLTTCSPRRACTEA